MSGLMTSHLTLRPPEFLVLTKLKSKIVSGSFSFRISGCVFSFVFLDQKGPFLHFSEKYRSESKF